MYVDTLLCRCLLCSYYFATLGVVYRCRKKRTIACLSMQKCVINTESCKFNRSSGDHMMIDQLSPSQYNKLQFDYDTDRSFPPTTHEGFSSMHLMPASHHQNQNTQSEHTTTPSSHDTNNNAIFQMQANGYVLPDDFGKQSLNVSATRSNLTSETQLKAADKRNKANHKTTVVLKSDGTGIIRTGTLQALIPSSGSDENYTVTPSQTHESYFDIVKDT